MSPATATDFAPVVRDRLETLQVNLGYRCNQRCVHCHVEAGPHRSEMMDADTLSLILPVLQARGIGTLDLTGGAPELHPGFRELVGAVREAGIRVLDRCNLTVLLDPVCAGMAAFLAEQGVEIIASLPCYLEENVDRQRGRGSFAASITALRQLNELGYGRAGSGLALHLVYNPAGPQLPPDQASLEADYRKALHERYGIVFTDLITLANMPVGRYAAYLRAKGILDDYRQLLRDNLDAANLERVMCRSLISVDWQGRLYDCDFNQQLDLAPASDGPRHLRDLLGRDPAGNPVRVAEHCFGCTAGQGSSCGGALR